MTHTIKQWDDRGRLAYRRRERLDRIIEVVSLAAQQHRVKLVLDGVGLDERRILQRYVAVGAFDHEACGGKLRGTARPHQKGDVAAGLQHPAAEISANGPGANDENAHVLTPVVVRSYAFFERADFHLKRRALWAVGKASDRRLVLLIVTTPPARTHSPCRHRIVRQG